MKHTRSLSPYYQDEKALGTRRFFAGLFDALIVIVLLTVISILTTMIMGKIPSYVGKIDTVNQERIECYKIEEEARIYRFVDNENGEYETPMSMELIFKEYALSEILLSYEKNPNDFARYNIVPENSLNVTLASYENNSLSYFFVTYATKYNNYSHKKADVYDFKDEDPRFSYIKELKNASPKSDYWVIDEETLDYPYLEGVFALDLYRYLFGGETSYQTGLTNYNYLAQAYKNLWQSEVNYLLNSTRFTSHYDVYRETYIECSHWLIVATLIAYILTFLLVIIIPVLANKDGQSLGMLILKLKSLSTSSEVISMPQKILRLLIYLFSFLPIIPIATFFSGGAESGLYYPLLVINDIGVSIIHITFFLVVLPIISLLLIASRQDKRGLADFASRTKVVDIRLHSDYKDDEPKHEKTDLEKLREENDQKTTFDSSSFNNTERPRRP